MSRTKISIFAQMLGMIAPSKFARVVKKHDTDKYSKGIDTWTHFVYMMFMQFADVSSLRDISNGIRSASGNLNHLGVRKAPGKSSLSYRNKHRTYEVFKDLYFELLEKLEPSLQLKRQYASVTRLKKNVNFEIVKELPVNEKHEHILSDQTIRLTSDETRNKYPGKIRVVEVHDPEND